MSSMLRLKHGAQENSSEVNEGIRRITNEMFEL